VPHDDIIVVANINQGGAPQLQRIVKINNTDNDSNTNNNTYNSSNGNNNSSKEMMTMIVLEITMRALKPSLSTPTKAIKKMTKQHENRNNNATGVCRSKHKNKGKTDRFLDYSLFGVCVC
jgi:hypothetical protein